MMVADGVSVSGPQELAITGNTTEGGALTTTDLVVVNVPQTLVAASMIV
jgi:hypothetical protein